MTHAVIACYISHTLHVCPPIQAVNSKGQGHPDAALEPPQCRARGTGSSLNRAIKPSPTTAGGLQSKALNVCLQAGPPRKGHISQVLRPGHPEGKVSVIFQRAGPPKPLRLFMGWKSRPGRNLGCLYSREGCGRAHSPSKIRSATTRLTIQEPHGRPSINSLLARL